VRNERRFACACYEFDERYDSPQCIHLPAAKYTLNAALIPPRVNTLHLSPQFGHFDIAGTRLRIAAAIPKDQDTT